MPLVSLFDRNLSNASSFRQSINNQHSEQLNTIAYPKANNTAAKENGCESSFVKQHCAHVVDRTLIEFSNSHPQTNSSSMSAATAARSPFHPHVVSEESYCAPWDLKTQEEKLKLLSEQRPTQTSSPTKSTKSTKSTTVTTLTDALLHPSNTARSGSSSSSSSIQQNPFHRTRSARTTSFSKKTTISRDPSPPVLPPLPPGGLVPPPSISTSNNGCQCNSNSVTRMRSVQNQAPSDNVDPSLKKISYCLNAHVVRSGTDTSRSFVFSSLSPSNERSKKVNTAPAKVELTTVTENRCEPHHITSQSSTTSLLSTTSSSSIESPLITDDTKPMSFEAALQRFKRLSSSARCTVNNNDLSSCSLPKTHSNNTSHESSTAYERPWDTLQTSLINSLSSASSSAHNRSGDSLQRMPNAEEQKSACPPPFPVSTLSPNSCRHATRSPNEKMPSNGCNSNTGEFNRINSNNNNNNRSFIPVTSESDTTIPIDRYFWYHYAMSRRTAENVLQTRPPGSFLVRQSESGNQNDYSLSIRTAKSCMHMRICYSSGVYILGECSRPFTSVSRMIEYFSQTSVPIRGAVPIKLGTPVFRCETLANSSPNNYHNSDMNDDLL